ARTSFAGGALWLTRARGALPEAGVSLRGRTGELLRLLGAVSLERRIFLVAAASLLPLAVLFSITLLDAARDQKGRLLDAHLQNARTVRSEEHTSELQSRENLVCRLLHEKKKT